LQRLLGNISEEASHAHDNINERVLQNETSVERFESVDPITGAKTVSVVERSVTQREVSTCCLPSSFHFFLFSIQDQTPVFFFTDGQILIIQ
jgi:hypothetical protein